MEDGATQSTVQHGGMTVQSVGVSEADAKAALEQNAPIEAPDGEEKPEKAAKEAKPAKLSKSDHARELGKLGGKAAAEKRAEGRDGLAERQGDGGRADGTRKTAEAAREGTAEQAGGEEAEGEEDDAPLSKRAQRRVEVATRKQAEAARALEAERQRVQRLEARLAALEVAREGRGQGADQGAQERPSRDADAKPRAADFESFEEYEDARDDWNRRQWTKEFERRQYAEREVNTFRGHVDGFLKHVTPEMVESIDPEIRDWKPYFLMGDGEQIGPENLIAAEIVYLGEKAPAVLRHLSDNPNEIARLRSLRSHPDIRVELQVLARTLGSRADATAGDPPASGEQAPKPARSKANPPVRPVTGAPHVADGDPAPRADEDFDAWIRRQKRA